MGNENSRYQNESREEWWEKDYRKERVLNLEPVTLQLMHEEIQKKEFQAKMIAGVYKYEKCLKKLEKKIEKKRASIAKNEAAEKMVAEGGKPVELGVWDGDYSHITGMMKSLNLTLQQTQQEIQIKKEYLKKGILRQQKYANKYGLAPDHPARMLRLGRKYLKGGSEEEEVKANIACKTRAEELEDMRMAFDYAARDRERCAKEKESRYEAECRAFRIWIRKQEFAAEYWKYWDRRIDLKIAAEIKEKERATEREAKREAAEKEGTFVKETAEQETADDKEAEESEETREWRLFAETEGPTQPEEWDGEVEFRRNGKKIDEKEYLSGKLTGFFRRQYKYDEEYHRDVLMSIDVNN